MITRINAGLLLDDEPSTEAPDGAAAPAPGAAAATAASIAPESEPEGPEPADDEVVPVPKLAAVAIGLCVAVTVVFGIIPAPLDRHGPPGHPPLPALSLEVGPHGGPPVGAGRLRRRAALVASRGDRGRVGLPPGQCRHRRPAPAGRAGGAVRPVDLRAPRPPGPRCGLAVLGGGCRRAVGRSGPGPPGRCAGQRVGHRHRRGLGRLGVGTQRRGRGARRGRRSGPGGGLRPGPCPPGPRPRRRARPGPGQHGGGARPRRLARRRRRRPGPPAPQLPRSGSPRPTRWPTGSGPAFGPSWPSAGWTSPTGESCPGCCGGRGWPTWGPTPSSRCRGPSARRWSWRRSP